MSGGGGVANLPCGGVEGWGGGGGEGMHIFTGGLGVTWLSPER